MLSFLWVPELFPWLSHSYKQLSTAITSTIIVNAAALPCIASAQSAQKITFPKCLPLLCGYVA
jgi:hypothetical protein